MRSRFFKIFLPAILTLAVSLTSGITMYAAENYIPYTVVSGDSLWKISTAYNVSSAQIMQFNDMTSTNLDIGQKLKIPVGAPANANIYTVKSGDVLWKVADTYKVAIQAIVDLNKLDPNQYLLVGQKLIIPQPAATPTPAPTPTATPTPTPSTNYTVYTVVSGDAVWKIAVKYGVTAQEILSANNLTESSTIYIGQKLNIPVKSTTPTPVPSDSLKPYITYTAHTVQSGDNAWNLSIKYGIPMTELLEVNKLTMDSVLSLGQKLTIPVHHVPVIPVAGSQYGEYLDWWTQAQYVIPIGAKFKVIDFATGRSYNVIRSYGASHADCEPLTPQDAKIMYELWGNQWSWATRASIIEYDGRRIAASVANMPHDIENITDNEFTGHFDIHFYNSTRHKDNLVDEYHQQQIKIAAGVQ